MLRHYPKSKKKKKKKRELASICYNVYLAKACRLAYTITSLKAICTNKTETNFFLIHILTA